MLTIKPKITSYSNNYSPSNQNRYIDEKVSIKQSQNDSVSFKGYYPSKKNRYLINKIVELIKNDANQRIALFPHKGPDGDAIGTALGLAHEIKEATGKIADVLVMHPLEREVSIIDAKNEVKIIKDILGEEATPEEIIKKFGKYDLSISVDNADISLFPDGLYESLFSTAKHTIKIDHHPAGKGHKNRNYAQINLIDTTKESAAQLVMEFVSAFGLNPKKVSTEISNPIAMGLLSDSQQFKYTRNPGIFLDAAELQKTSDFEKLIKSLEKVEKEEFSKTVEILNGVRFANNGKIAYLLIDMEKEEKPSSEIVGRALVEISKIKGVNYYFSVKAKTGEIKASVRSNDKPIRDKMLELGGDGHSHACGLKSTNQTLEEFLKALTGKLSELDEN